ncbi:MAG: NADH-quinone oxidoreductase subunit D [Anaerolineae bacterium]
MVLTDLIKVLKAGAEQSITKPITYRFPPESPLSEAFRGRHILDPAKCIHCGLCAKICPNEAIEMVESAVGGEGGRYPQIDYARCSFCGLCEDRCPVDALNMTSCCQVISTHKEDFVYPPERLARFPELNPAPERPKTRGILSWARAKSLWMIFYFTGCGFIELAPWLSSGFDMERFGLLAKGSPRHSDAFIIAGYVTRKTLKRVIRIYEQMPRPRFVIALGCCPARGGTYWDSYNTIKSIDEYLPVDVWIAGCPPRPEAIGAGVIQAINAIQDGYTGKKEKVKERRKLDHVGPGRVPVPVGVEKPKEDKVLIPFGPQHPSPGNFALNLKVTGELVKEADPVVGYLHRGFEKLMEYRTWYQNIMLVPRICVFDGAAYELSYCSAVEELAGIEIPQRARYLRLIQAELSRIQSHLLTLGMMSSAAGFDTVNRITWGDRERILALLERLTGGRIYHIYCVPGGVRRDMPHGFQQEASEMITWFRRRLKRYDDLLMGNPAFKTRTVGIGKIPPNVAIDHDITGPNLRASGVGFDVRKATPYPPYDELDFSVPTFKEGDAYHRTMVRRLEIEESLKLIQQALDTLPDGSTKEKFSPRSSVPEGEAMRFVESGRGELGFHVISNGSRKPYRVKVRGPTFDPILVLLPKLLQGVQLADVPVVYWSLDNCPADHDR